MNVTMIILLAGLAGPQTAEFNSMEACLKQAPIIKAQSAIENVACIPSNNERKIDINNFNDMLDGFLRMVDTINERQMLLELDTECYEYDGPWKSPFEDRK
jgi:hypothetical protein